MKNFNIHDWQAKFTLQEEVINYTNTNKRGQTEIAGNLEGVDQKFRDELDYALTLLKPQIEKGLKYHTNLEKIITNLSLNIDENGKINCKIEFK